MIATREKRNQEVAIGNTITNKVEVNINVLGAGVKHMIDRKIGGTKVVILEAWWFGKKHAEFRQKRLKP